MTSDMTPLRFRLSEAAIIRAAGLNASRYNARIALFIVVVALLVSGFFIAEGNHRTIDRILLQIVLTVAGTCVIAGVVTCLIRYFILPMQARKNMRQQKALSEEMHLSWTRDAFCYASGQSRTVMPFTNLYGFKASDDVILLYNSNILYHLVPTTAFSHTGLQEVFVQHLVDAAVRRL